jgi:hypothetical protein
MSTREKPMCQPRHGGVGKNADIAVVGQVAKVSWSNLKKLEDEPIYALNRG